MPITLNQSKVAGVKISFPSPWLVERGWCGAISQLLRWILRKKHGIRHFIWRIIIIKHTSRQTRKKEFVKWNSGWCFWEKKCRKASRHKREKHITSPQNNKSSPKASIQHQRKVRGESGALPPRLVLFSELPCFSFVFLYGPLEPVDVVSLRHPSHFCGLPVPTHPPLDAFFSNRCEGMAQSLCPCSCWIALCAHALRLPSWWVMGDEDTNSSRGIRLWWISATF